MEDCLIYSTPAAAFEEALPLGNGTMGAMVYGKTDHERLSLNLDTLWSGKPRHYSAPAGARTAYERARQLTLEGNVTEAERLLEKDFTNMWGQSYLPLGDLEIDLPEGRVKDYCRTLDLAKGIASLRYQSADNAYFREYFISYPGKGLFVKLQSANPAHYTLRMSSQLKHTLSEKNGLLIMQGECFSDIAPSYARGDKPEVYDGEGIKFTVLVEIITDGSVEVDESGAFAAVSDSRETVLRLFAATSFISFDKLPAADSLARAMQAYEEMRQQDYVTCRQAHIADFKALYERVSLEIDAGISGVGVDFTDRRLLAGNDPLLPVLLFNFGRYLMIASSRPGSHAANLQGIWNESLYAPWSSNYTVNINTEMNYWPVFSCALPECSDSLVDLIHDLSVSGERTAREYYGGEGFVSHHNVDLWALSTPVGNHGGGCLSYAFWNLSSGWLCRHLFERYEYTLDRDFLKTTAYPIMKKAARFYLSQLIDYEGRKILCPSTSPENRYCLAGESLALARYTAMSQSILAELFTNCRKSCAILGVDEAFSAELEEVIPLLKPFEIGSGGALLEFDGEYEETDPHHRHMSHLYGLYPADLITPNRTPALADACRQSLELRTDESTGWSMGWKVNLWARLHDGNRAMKLVRNQLRPVAFGKDDVHYSGGGTYKNLFDAHPPFQIDGNFGVTAGIAELFLQCTDGEIKLLPALPDDFSTGRVKGLLAKGNVVTEIEFEQKRLTAFTLTSEFAQTVQVNTGERRFSIKLQAGKPYIWKRGRDAQ